MSLSGGIAGQARISTDSVREHPGLQTATAVPYARVSSASMEGPCLTLSDEFYSAAAFQARDQGGTPPEPSASCQHPDGGTLGHRPRRLTWSM